MWAMRIRASALAIDFSQSIKRWWQRPSHARIRSTTHSRGRTSKLCAVSEHLTICTVLSDDLQGVSQFGARIATVRENIAGAVDFLLSVTTEKWDYLKNS